MTQPASATSDSSASAGSASPGDEHPPEEGIIFNARRVTQAFVIVATAICFAMFWYAGKWAGYPAEYKHSGSVLLQSGGIVKLFVFWVVLIAGTALATVLTGWRWFLAGLFSACLGSAAWVISGGILRYVLFSASSPKVFLVLAGEQVLLLGGVAALWLILWQFKQAQPPVALEANEPGKKEEPIPPGDPIYAIATQTLTMGIIVLLLAATDSTKQVAAAVFIGAAGATGLAQFLQKKADNLGRWYWVGPMIVGLIGYIGCYLSPHGWDTGLPIGTFAPLARPLLICYASYGVAGALLGYWWAEGAAAIALMMFMPRTAMHIMAEAGQQKKAQQRAAQAQEQKS